MTIEIYAPPDWLLVPLLGTTAIVAFIIAAALLIRFCVIWAGPEDKPGRFSLGTLLASVAMTYISVVLFAGTCHTKERIEAEREASRKEEIERQFTPQIRIPRRPQRASDNGTTEKPVDRFTDAR